jgi:hypothetical protein
MVEKGRLQLESSLGKKVSEHPISTNKPGTVVHICTQAMQKVQVGRLRFEAGLGQKV